ncbi:MAG: DEAD/DEAH box helicase [Bacillota bacterium]
MLLFPVGDNEIALRSPYYPEIVDKMREIPQAHFADWEWRFPRTSLANAIRSLGLVQGHFYPYFPELIQKNNTMPGLHAVWNETELILSVNGPNDSVSRFADNLTVLCGYEEVEEKWEEVAEPNGNTRKVKKYYHTYPTLADLKMVQPGYLKASLPQGAIYRVAKFMSYLGTAVEKQGVRRLPTHSVTFGQLPKDFQQRDYQVKISEEFPKKRLATLVLPTGAGKTATAFLIIRKLAVPALFLTYSTQLLTQTAGAFEHLMGIPIGKIGEGYFSLGKVTVATVQTINSLVNSDWNGAANEIAMIKAGKGNRLGDDKKEALFDFLAKVELVVVDEGHQLGAETIYGAATLARPSYVLGLTATPQREDFKEICIEAATGPIWRPAYAGEKMLIEGGWLLPVKVLVLPFKQKKSRFKRPDKVRKELIVQNEGRNKLILTWAKKYMGKYKTVISVRDLDHGKLLSERLGIPFICGATSVEERLKIIKQLNDGDIKGLVASSILDQGIDIPPLELLIDAVPRKSVINILQVIGRVRRPDNGNLDKKAALIVTVYDMDGGSLEKAAKRRMHILKSANFGVSHQWKTGFGE